MKEPRTTLLNIYGLKKYYGETRAVDGISMDIKNGEIYGLLGPNGAGKTTTIKCILGLLDVDGGSVQVLGVDPTDDPGTVKTNIGFVAEEPTLYRSLTPAELLDFITSIRQLDPTRYSQRAVELLEALDAIQYYHSAIITLSKGNQQKIQIVAALLHDPPLLLMDEPLSGLDAKTSRIVKEMITLHAERGGAVLLSTHVMEHAAELCHRVGIINKGKLVAEGSLEELRAQAAEAGASLESVFLRLTEQDRSIHDTIQKMRAGVAMHS